MLNESGGHPGLASVLISGLLFSDHHMEVTESRYPEAIAAVSGSFVGTENAQPLSMVEIKVAPIAA